jgi:hypothetical protein
MTAPTDDTFGLATFPELTPPDLSLAIEAELVRLVPTRTRRPHRQWSVLVGAGALYATVVVLVLTTRVDLSELPVGWITAVAAGWFVGFAVAAYVALVPRSGMVTPRWYLAAWVAAVASLGFVALGLGVHPQGPSSLIYGWERLGHGHFCLELGVAISICPVVLGAVFLRGTLPIRSRRIAAVLGAGSGCLGGLVLHLFCKIADGPHIGIMHGGVVGVTVVLAALLVPRFMDRPRSHA